MEQRISMVTLGVGDVVRARSFYEALGWRGQTVEETVFFAASGIVLVLWDRAKLAADAGLASPAPPGSDGVVLAHNVRSRSAVNELMAAAAAAGAIVTRPAVDTFYGGYAGYFADLDGHLWEIAYNPGMGLDADGAVVLPDFSSLAEPPREGAT